MLANNKTTDWIGVKSLDLDLLAYYLDPVQQAVMGSVDGFIVYANPSAKTNFGKNICGKPESELIHPDILWADKIPFSCFSSISRKPSIIFVTQIDKISLFYITVISEENLLKITPSMISYLRNCLSNLKMSADLYFESIENDCRYDSHFYHSYYCLLRGISQIDNAIKLSKGEYRINTKLTDLVSLCYDLTNTVSKLSENADIDIRFVCKETSAVADVDPENIELVLMNLFSNSLKHASSGDRITLNLTKTTESILISVSDTGIGISEVVLSRIFRINKDEFESLNPNTGLNLGLFISESIIKLHKGIILIESREGEGTLVRIKLPARQQSSPKVAAEGKPYRSVGISAVLTVLSDVLDSNCYGQEFED